MTDQVQAIVTEELADPIRIAHVLSINMHRALRLLHESVRLEEHTDDKEAFLEYMYDITRATIVFLHSSLETTLREVVSLKLEHDADVTDIPLVGHFQTEKKNSR